jgi:hypothetical protein
MAVTGWLGASYTGNGTWTKTGNPDGSNNGGTSPADYPFTDPIFQQFNVQQYVTLGTAGAAQTYSVEAPKDETLHAEDDVAAEETTPDAANKPETPAQRKARLKGELAALDEKDTLTAKEKARKAQIESALETA